MGGTGTRGALFNSDGAELARAQGPAGALSLGAAQSAAAVLQVWGEICLALGRPCAPAGDVKMIAGVAGHGLPGMTELLKRELGDFGEIDVVGDGYGALLGATGGKPGVLISVGTGVGALRLDERGRTKSVSGWGFPAGDRGSGAWIGLQLTGDLLLHLDGIDPDPPLPGDLAADLLDIMGHTPRDIMNWHMGAQPRDFASLAPLVAGGAKKGNAYCNALVARAAGEISRVARALECKGNETVFLRGGLAETLLPHCRKQAGDINWTLSGGDPVNGLFLMATGQAPKQVLLPRFRLA